MIYKEVIHNLYIYVKDKIITEEPDRISYFQFSYEYISSKKSLLKAYDY